MSKQRVYNDWLIEDIIVKYSINLIGHCFPVIIVKFRDLDVYTIRFGLNNQSFHSKI